MKKLLAIALITVFALAGCKETQNDIAAIVNPLIGTWTATILLVPTTLVLNADKTYTETTTVLGVGVTKNGTWASTDTVLTQTASDNSVTIQNYTFSTNNTELTLSYSGSGIATTYTKS